MVSDNGGGGLSFKILPDFLTLAVVVVTKVGILTLAVVVVLVCGGGAASLCVVHCLTISTPDKGRGGLSSVMLPGFLTLAVTLGVVVLWCGGGDGGAA